MAEEFSGTLTLSAGRRERVTVVFDGDQVELRAGSAAVGTWPVEACRIRRTGPREFRLEMEGEVLDFVPDRPVPFGSAVAKNLKKARIADRIDAVRVVGDVAGGDEPGTVPEPAPTRPVSVEVRPDRTAEPRDEVVTRVVGVVATGLFVILLAVAAAVVLRSRDRPDVSDPAPPPTTTTTAPSVPSVFDVTPPEMAARWNETAARLGAPLRIRNRLGAGDFEAALTPYVTLQGTVGGDGTVDSIVVVVDPTGGTRDDELAIASWGITIATVDPTLEGPERRLLLDRLGLDIDRPDLTFLDGETEQNGLRYTLRYLEDFVTILFTVEPAG